MGHTPEVAEEHYLQTTAEHFRRAVGKEAGEKVTRKVTQKTAETTRKVLHR